MRKLTQFGRYLGATLLFLACYALVSLPVRLFALFVSTTLLSVRGFMSHGVAYLAAYFAGYLGALAACAAVEHFAPAVRLRPVVWVFIAFVGFFWSFALFGILVGNNEPGLLVNLVQSVSAVVWALLTSSKAGFPHLGRSRKSDPSSNTGQEAASR